MILTKDYNEKKLIVAIEGRIDTITSQELDNEINNELGNFESLTLDFTGVEYISSAGLRVLVAIQKKLKATNVPFIIKNVNDNVNEIFKMSGFDKILTIE